MAKRVAEKARMCSLLRGIFWLLLAGCNRGDAVTELEDALPEPPQEWRDGGLLWRWTAEYGPADGGLLERYFRQQPDLAGSPDIAGQPLVFTSGASDRQYVWLRQAVDGSYWYSVRHVAGRFSARSGQGVPWQSAEHSGESSQRLGAASL